MYMLLSSLFMLLSYSMLSSVFIFLFYFILSSSFIPAVRILIIMILELKNETLH